MTLIEERPAPTEPSPSHPTDDGASADRVCVIGAGMSGLGIAQALKRDGMAFDVVEATGRLGGNWSHGVYDSAHLISSKRTTAYVEHPMPEDYPDFPSAAQVLAYFDSYVDRFELGDHIEFGKEVTDVSPVDETGRDGWVVSFADGERRRYAAVVVANGHDWSSRIPEYPGSFAGTQLHSKQYRNPSSVPGDRVLVVGAGNSAIDVASELSEAKPVPVDVSMRRTYWFIPKTLFGIPSADFNQWWMPQVVAAPLLHLLLLLIPGPHSRYGMPRPRHGIFSVSLTVNDGFLEAVKHGHARYRPGIDRLDGNTVHFVDGTSGEYDAIVWGTGFDVTVPFVDPRYIEYADGKPVLIGRCIPSTGVRNLYLLGYAYPTNGGGPIISHAGGLLTGLIRLQWRSRRSVAPLASLMQRRRSDMVLNSGSFIRRSWVAARILRVVLAVTRTPSRVRG